MLFSLLKLIKKLFLYRKNNFTILREFDVGNGTMVKEYVYNMNTYLTDTWPPNTSEKGFPIKEVRRDEDGLDVTERVLKFSGPRKNYVNPLSLCTVRHRKRTLIRFINFGIRFSYDMYDVVWEPYEGSVTVTDILGGIKNMNTSKTNNGAHLSS